MCGLVGFASNEVLDNPTFVLNRMLSKIVKRGPDGQGIWLHSSNRVALGHTRLSLVDLSKNGDQPMASICGRYILIFNGEIYNFRKLRRSINYPWKSNSDTETILGALVCFGLDRTLEMLDGMFAFALYDLQLNQLILVRDRSGEKPLYFSTKNGALIFSSDLSAISLHPSQKKEICLHAVDAYLVHGYVPAPASIYRGVKKLLPGHLIKYSLENGVLESRAYWELSEPDNVYSEQSQNDLISDLENTLISSVERASSADVEVGSLLSGGIDSTLITCLMQSTAQKPIRTFTIGSSKNKFNEATFAKNISNYLRTNHTELYVSDETLVETCDKVNAVYDEPFSDTSKILFYLVSKLAVSEVKAVLSGDGADELFGGYNRYVYGGKFFNSNLKIPLVIRENLGSTLQKLSPICRFLGKSEMDIKVQKLAASLSARDNQEFYHKVSSLRYASTVGFGSYNWRDGLVKKLTSGSIEEQMMYWDFKTYLPDNVLVKVDRASMFCGLEVRSPFLSKEVMEFSRQLPMLLKIKNRSGKNILKEILRKHVPEELWDRPKQGFTPPISDWMRGPLREWCEAKISIPIDFFDTEKIKIMWNRHIKGDNRFTYDLWAIISFIAWYEGVEW
jgi:asparagine synthase (glutamine-hydrolysing)